VKIGGGKLYFNYLLSLAGNLQLSVGNLELPAPPTFFNPRHRGKGNSWTWCWGLAE